MALIFTSSAFSHHQEIPLLYTCDGSDLSPPLNWSGVTQGTKSLALLVYDPDVPDPAAPKMTWVHWVLYNLPPAATDLAQGIASVLTCRPAPWKAKNDWQRTGYGSPCPPIGRHRYFFHLVWPGLSFAGSHKTYKNSTEKGHARPYPH